eukprot:CAMPEP_0194447590 /NCGR_PEP_ID=MMETSP0176-20130528/129091_1 /TAXON_ID=216777 /ORGANISM="Proboscia alata, Strain PI-D3" /LENGTH=751 /DNA_ID=CAMNT_0039274459 /DNA_START=399 /DNA_END=2655 /DNA_ORIENTATION=-
MVDHQYIVPNQRSNIVDGLGGTANAATVPPGYYDTQGMAVGVGFPPHQLYQTSDYQLASSGHAGIQRQIQQQPYNTFPDQSQQQYYSAPSQHQPLVNNLQQQEMYYENSTYHQQQLTESGTMQGSSIGGLPLVDPMVQSAKPEYNQRDDDGEEQRHPSQRPIVKLSISLIDTYKQINKVYYEEREEGSAELVKLSISLIDTYKQINKVYYEEREARKRRTTSAPGQSAGNVDSSGIASLAHQHEHGKQQQRPAPNDSAAIPSKLSEGDGAIPTREGPQNDGYDDANYDYIITPNEIINKRYIIKDRVGKGSFGQVVRAYDRTTNIDVAIKIIKSKKPFLEQAKTEVELLANLCQKDPGDEHNIVRLHENFMFRNHQCLVFEMLSLNLYELLKSTHFNGVSLNLIRKFAKYILDALLFLAMPHVDIIHCDLKPENILLRHPKRSGVKVVDFGSSCRSNKQMYKYIQSRFYRSPEVMLGLPYTVAIDMWSLGCILVEMHTGEPLFSGSDQFDQMQKIVKILGMIPHSMIERSSDNHRLQFFERHPQTLEWVVKSSGNNSNNASATATTGGTTPQQRHRTLPSSDPIASLTQIVTSESSRERRNDTCHSPRNYELFVDLIYRMLSFDPAVRIRPADALRHPFITECGNSSDQPAPSQNHRPMVSPTGPTYGGSMAVSSPRRAVTSEQHHHQQQSQHVEITPDYHQQQQVSRPHQARSRQPTTRIGGESVPSRSGPTATGPQRQNRISKRDLRKN